MYISRLLIISFLCLSFSAVCTGQGSRRRQRNRQTSRRGNRNGGLPSNLEQVYHAAASDVTPTMLTPTTTIPPREEERSMSADDPWHRFIPSTPTASEVECYFEVVVVRRQGGRCIRVGGTQRTAVCQSGVHIDFNPECEELLAAREALQNQNQGPSTPEP